jgi:hypothetical protein
MGWRERDPGLSPTVRAGWVMVSKKSTLNLFITFSFVLLFGLSIHGAGLPFSYIVRYRNLFLFSPFFLFPFRVASVDFLSPL